MLLYSLFHLPIVTAMTATPRNVDPGEIAKFSELASRWWDPDSEFKPLHAINPLRLEFIDQRAHLPGKRVLDVGCGGGILAEEHGRARRRRGRDRYGRGAAGGGPAAPAGIRSGGGLPLYHVEELAELEPAGFDVVTCMEMLEHVPDPASVVRACARLVKPDGQVFFATINRTPKAYLFAVVGAEYVLRLLPQGTHDYRKFIRPSELDTWAREAGLNLGELTGMHYNPLTQHYWLAPGVEVNYLAHYRLEP